MSVFDGLADAFTDTFGEAVIYTPFETGVPKTIRAIWWETSLSIALGNDAGVEGGKTELSLRAADVADPKQGDLAERVADGKVMTVTTPIDADGKGMIVCNLSEG